jgi:uncharacterized membrane protein
VPQEKRRGAPSLTEFMPISCPDCAAPMPDDAAFCPGCGRAMVPAERAQGMVGVMPETMAGALAYFILPAVAFLLIEPYSKNRFVRFHSFQCIGALLAGVVLAAVLRIVAVIAVFVPVIGQLFLWLLSMLVSLAVFMIWIVLVVKALQGEMFKLPLIGDIAEQQGSKA